MTSYKTYITYKQIKLKMCSFFLKKKANVSLESESKPYSFLSIYNFLYVF